jgi:hypothetical protein
MLGMITLVGIGTLALILFGEDTDSVTTFAMLIIITLIGSCTLALATNQMKGGFGPQNLRVVGIVLVATLVSLLAILNEQALNAGIGILGAIIGYLFGSRSD